MAKEAPRRFFENQTSTQYPPVMAYFDVTKETSLTVDASPVGISAILSQNTKNRDDSKIIAYASHSFTDVERRYSQTEKEALSFVWAIKHFHLFLYGQQFTLITDHKPLEIIYGTTRSKPSARIDDGFYDYNSITLKFSINQEVRTLLITYPDTHQIK